jgi:hypothetical protein
MGRYAGVDYNPTLCPFHSRLQHNYQGQKCQSIDLNPMPVDFIPESGTLDLASGLSSPSQFSAVGNSCMPVLLITAGGGT